MFMKKWIKLGFPFVLILVLIMCFVSADSIKDIGGYGKLINYVGIVRGASQRAIKLETNGEPDDELIGYVSGILDELLCGEGKYGLARTQNTDFNEELEHLESQWEFIQNEIKQVRKGKDKTTLLKYSEVFFQSANKAVFSIEEYSGRRSSSLTVQMVAMAIICLVISVTMIAYYIKRYFELRQKAELLTDQAGRDKLTGTLNAERFEIEAQELLANNKEINFAVQYIDFENFKYINDVFGYATGDKVLKKYADIMTKSLGKNELFARSVADCFLVLRCYDDKKLLLERQMEVDKSFVKYGILSDNHDITVACGFCCLEDTIEKLDISGLINRANYARKTIKNKPGEHYAFYDESIRQKMFTEIKISDRMESALEHGEFLVYYQPKVSPKDSSIQAAEALVRWKNPDGSFCYPDEFIPIFEKNHQIIRLDMFVFEDVCRFLRDRYDQGLPVVPVSVNVSKIRFYTPGFVKSYTEVKNRYKIPDGMLEIEFTETVACENREYMVWIVKSLHENGFVCSLDDFGTGYSSLGMLNDLPIDVLKLDAIFFRGSEDMERSWIIVKGILGIINHLNLRTVAEGVETESQALLLKEWGCDLIQGYYYYRPMPEEDFAKTLNEKTN